MHLRSAFPKTASGKKFPSACIASSGNRPQRRAASRVQDARRRNRVGVICYADHLGTPRAITKATDNAKVWEWSNSEPFGNNAPNEDPSASGTAFKFNLRFPGQYYDQETGTHYNYHRDYDPATGRYIQSDPIGLFGGLNTFAYVSGSPLAMIDPYGLDGNSADRRKARREKERETPPKIINPNPDNREYWEKGAQFFSPYDYNKVCVEWKCTKYDNMCSTEDDRPYNPYDFIPAYYPKVKELDPGCKCTKSKFRNPEIQLQELEADDIAEIFIKWRQRNTVRR